MSEPGGMDAVSGPRGWLGSLSALFAVEASPEPDRSADPGGVRLALAVGVAAALWFALAAFVAPYVSDDSFILFRHVKHLLEGHGAVWDPVYPFEAHSSPLWVALIAIVCAFGVSPPTAGVALGIACGAVAMGQLVAVTRGLGDVRLRLVLVALVATNPSVTTWTNAGLEMPLALVAVLAFAQAIGAVWRRPDARAVAALVVVCALGPTIRPDLPLQLFAALVALGLLPGAPRRALLLAAGGIVLAGLALAVWRWGYYGDYVALPQRAKSVVEPYNLYRYARYLVLRGPMLIVVTAAVAFLWLLRPTRPRAVEISATLLAGAIMAEHALLGGDELVRGRFTVQPLALLVIPLVRPLGGPGPRWRVPLAAAAAGLLLLAHVASGLRPLPSGDDVCGERREALGRWLADHTTPDFSIATVAAGYIPYYAERPAMDLLGLTHPEIARSDFGRYTPEYGFEGASVADREEICGIVIPVCGSLPEPSCPLPEQAHPVLRGLREYVERSDDYVAGEVRLGPDEHVVLYVRRSCRDRIRGLSFCEDEGPGDAAR